MHTYTSRADVEAVLTDPTFVVPPEPPGPGAMAWLRVHVARFSAGEEHARRRRLVTELLDALDPAHLRASAHAAARAGTPTELIPAEVLTTALGLPGTADLVATAASGYLPGGAQGPEVDAAVGALRARLTRPTGDASAPDPHTRRNGDDEAVAARIGLLLQANNATVALIRAAASRDGDLDAALRDDPPAKHTRRRAPTGEPLTLDLASAGLPWGAGPHACPGQAHARALAQGALAGARPPKIATGDTPAT